MFVPELQPKMCVGVLEGSTQFNWSWLGRATAVQCLTVYHHHPFEGVCVAYTTKWHVGRKFAISINIKR